LVGEVGNWRQKAAHPSNLGLRLWRGKFACLLLVLKSRSLMRAIAKRLAGGVPAAAEGNCTASSQAIRPAFHIDKFEFSFNTQWPVISYYNFRRRHSRSILAGSPQLSKTGFTGCGKIKNIVIPSAARNLSAV